MIHRRFHNKSNGGFTLIETLIVIAVSVSMMISVGVLIYNFNKTYNYNSALSKSSGSASTIMREMELLIMQADAILQTHTFPDSTRTSSSTALVLEIPSIDSSGNAISNTYDYAAFYTVGTNAYRLLETNASSKRTSGTKLLSSTVNTLTFSFNGADFTKISTTTVDVQTRTLVKQDILSDHRSEQIRLRNY